MVPNFHLSTMNKPKAFQHSIIMLNKFQIREKKSTLYKIINVNYTDSNHSLAKKKKPQIIHI